MKRYLITLLLIVAAFFSFGQNPASFSNLDVRYRTRLMGSIFMTGISNTGTARALYINSATGEVTWSAPGGTIPLTVSTVNYSSTIGSEAVAFTDLSGNDTLTLGTAVGRTNNMIYVARTDLLGDSVVITGAPTLYYNSTGYPTFYLSGSQAGCIIQSDGISWYIIGVWQDEDLSVYSTWERDTLNHEIYPKDLTDQVGIGTADPTEMLEVGGNVKGDTLFENRIANKKWVIFGDSFSEGLTTQWPKYVIDRLKFTGTVTNAKGGNGISEQLDTLDVRLVATPTYLDGFNILTLFIGINDYTGGMPIGKLSDVAGTATFTGYLKDFIETVYTNNPDIELYIMTNTQAYKVIYSGRNGLGYNLEDLAIRISQVCDLYGVSCIDVYHLIGLNPQTFTTLLGSDSLHPSVTGYKAIARLVSEAFINNTGLQGLSINHNDILLEGNNIGVGIDPLPALTSGALNTAIGYQALNSVTSGQSNVGIGTYALTSVTTQSTSVGIGFGALRYTTAISTAVGPNAGGAQTTGVGNSYFGNNAGTSNVIGTYNTYNGNESGMYFTSDNNTAIGFSALKGNNGTSTGYENTAIGSLALFNNRGGYQNTAIGMQAAYTNQAANGITAVGAGALLATTVSSTAFGFQAGTANSTGANNTYIGNQAGFSNLIGGANTYVGTYSGGFSTGGKNTAIGYGTLLGSGGSSTGGENTAIGNNSLPQLESGTKNTAIGAESGYSNLTGGSNIFLGYQAGYNTLLSNRLVIDNANRGSAAADSTASFIWGNMSAMQLGLNAKVGIKNVAPDSTLTVTGSGHITTNLKVDGFINLPTTSATVGQIKMNGVTFLHKYGTNNIFMGTSAGNYTTSGTGNNVAIGQKSMEDISTGNNNVAIGQNAMLNSTTATGNVAVGWGAMGTGITTGSGYNTAVGKDALKAATSGTYNVAIGMSSGGALTTTDYNTFIGVSAGASATGTGNIMIGYNVGAQQVAGDNKLFIDNSNTTTPLIGGDFATNQIKINGNLSIGVGSIADNDATPDVSGANTYVYAGSANAVTITDLDLPVIGAIYHIIGNSDVYTVTIADGGNFKLAGASAVLGIDDVLNLICTADNYYVELSRSNN
jgi:lysophospholipase L1-like esterase